VAYKRRIYLINPDFQIKFSLYVCGLVLLSSIAYPFTIYDILSEVITNLGRDNPALTSSIETRKNTIIMILSLWQLGFTALVFVICIFFSHKVAGPLFKLRKFLNMLKEGQTVPRLSFRKGDYFQDIAEDFNSAFEKVQNEHKNDFAYLSEVNTYLNNLTLVVPEDKRIVLREIRKKLDEIQERFSE
jgi:hypothetical protein